MYGEDEHKRKIYNQRDLTLGVTVRRTPESSSREVSENWEEGEELILG